MPNLSCRWQPSPHNNREYFASIPHYVDPAKSISLVLEADSSGKVWPTVTAGNKQLPTKEETYPGFEPAADACCKAVMKHFQASRNGPYLLGFLPWRGGPQLSVAMRSTATAVCQWANARYRLGRWTTTHCANLMGLRGYARGGGEVYRLEMAYWDSPEYHVDPIKGKRKVHPREKPRPGQVGRPKNLKKPVDSDPKV